MLIKKEDERLVLGAVTLADGEVLTVEAILRGYIENGGLAVVAYDVDGLPYAKLSVNLREANRELGHGEFCAKLWSENARMREPLLKSGLFEDTGRRITAGSVGFVNAEVWKITAPGWKQQALAA